jgi:hypothetical protein
MESTSQQEQVINLGFLLKVEIQEEQKIEKDDEGRDSNVVIKQVFLESRYHKIIGTPNYKIDFYRSEPTVLNRSSVLIFKNKDLHTCL